MLFRKQFGLLFLFVIIMAGSTLLRPILTTARISPDSNSQTSEIESITIIGKVVNSQDSS
jgi:hypothetical protein